MPRQAKMRPSKVGNSLGGALRWTAVAAAVLAVVLASQLQPASADGQDILYESLPGCWEYTQHGVGLFGDGAGQLDYVGPAGATVETAWFGWVGADDLTPQQLDGDGGSVDSTLVVNGTDVVGIQTPGEAGHSEFKFGKWYSWNADLGPDGYDLVAGTDGTLDISGWDTEGNIGNNGGTLTVLWSVADCEAPQIMTLLAGVDWYYHGDATAGGLSGIMSFEFDASAVDRVAEFSFSHSGSDFTRSICRGDALWMLAGSGAAPEAGGLDLVYQDGSRNPGVGINGGVEIANDIFAGANQGCEPRYNPAPDAPYEDGHPYPGGADTAPYGVAFAEEAAQLEPFGLSLPSFNLSAFSSSPSIVGAGIFEQIEQLEFEEPPFIPDAEWAIVKLSVRVPAGATWAAFQFESEADEAGESGAWAGSTALRIASTHLVGDLVYIDRDCDGIQDDVIEGIENITIELLDDDGVVVATTTTDADGAYFFSEVFAGRYTVRFSNLGNYYWEPNGETADWTISDGAITSTPFLLVDGTSNLTLDLGVCIDEEPPPPTTVPPTTAPPTTAPPVTAPPTTAPPVTAPPTTAPPTTRPPVTAPPTTRPPVTAPPTTKPPVTAPPTTKPPVTAPPTTAPPTTAPPTTAPPTTAPPTTAAPTTAPPTTAAPPPSFLPRTGGDVASLVSGALATIGLGTALAVSTRRRRN